MTHAPRYAVFGHPVAHSLSPRLHALFGAQCGVALEYVAIDASPGEFPRSVRSFFAGGGRGANVTLPHKRAAFELADSHDAEAQRLGVANVLTQRPDGRIEARSNDGVGLLRDLERCHADPRDREVLVLGAGGAARAAAFALLDAGARTLVIANRTFDHACALAQALGRPDRVRVSGWDDLSRCGAFGLIVNATSAGVQHASLDLPASLTATGTTAYDLSYGAAAGSFLDWARGAGCASAFDGLGMLVETAADSFAHWHGDRPDTDSALQALRGHPA
jgi:shikimate dehydrogenase